MKDLRDKHLAFIERHIQKRAKKKDKKFRFKGKWKKFVRNQGGLKIYAVDGEWVRSNLSVTFGQGGHGYVHEFIPLDEIWIDTRPSFVREFEDICILNKKRKRVSSAYFESTVVHEIAESEKMKKGTSYWKAHMFALQKERGAGFLKNPFEDEY